MGKHVLGFLKSTPETCLLYRPCSKDHGVLGTLQVPRHDRPLEAFADISFAPGGDRSHQGIVLRAAGSQIQWEATRQAFHTMSTAESELVGLLRRPSRRPKSWLRCRSLLLQLRLAGRRELRALLLWACWRFGLLPTGTRTLQLKVDPMGSVKTGGR